ncbi:UNVERIFIED_CONTAM: hypothetical protein GTU68_044827 [Idotea baltica]|nr:hypothetical protein [Idotea baltica]
MAYLEAFVAPVPKASKDDYLSHAEMMASVLKENGALQITECWESNVPDGEQTSFPLAVKRAEGEAIVMGWILWPSREKRDEGFQKAMSDPRMADFKPPFDMKRMIFGGFEPIVEL